MPEILIRREETEDIEAVYGVHAEAFDTSMEADLVSALRERADSFQSWVAVVEGEVVGSLVCSEVSIAEQDGPYLGLAPMAVLPGWQRKGIGSELVKACTSWLKLEGSHALVVLGHPAYYPRFGFKPSEEFGLKCEYDVPPGIFRVLELVPGSLAELKGVVKYHPVFAEVG